MVRYLPRKEASIAPEIHNAPLINLIPTGLEKDFFSCVGTLFAYKVCFVCLSIDLNFFLSFLCFHFLYSIVNNISSVIVDSLSLSMCLWVYVHVHNVLYMNGLGKGFNFEVTSSTLISTTVGMHSFTLNMQISSTQTWIHFTNASSFLK